MTTLNIDCLKVDHHLYCKSSASDRIVVAGSHFFKGFDGEDAMMLDDSEIIGTKTPIVRVVSKQPMYSDPTRAVQEACAGATGALMVRETIDRSRTEIGGYKFGEKIPSTVSGILPCSSGAWLILQPNSREVCGSLENSLTWPDEELIWFYKQCIMQGVEKIRVDRVDYSHVVQNIIGGSLRDMIMTTYHQIGRKMRLQIRTSRPDVAIPIAVGIAIDKFGFTMDGIGFLQPPEWMTFEIQYVCPRRNISASLDIIENTYRTMKHRGFSMDCVGWEFQGEDLAKISECEFVFCPSSYFSKNHQRWVSVSYIDPVSGEPTLKGPLTPVRDGDRVGAMVGDGSPGLMTRLKGRTNGKDEESISQGSLL